MNQQYWYPKEKKELELYTRRKLLEKKKILQELIKKNKNIHGIIVPHAGYSFCGEIMAESFSFLIGSSVKEAIIFGANHYIENEGVFCHNKPYWITPLGRINALCDNHLLKKDLSTEHSIDNQIPFLQILKFKKIMPVVINTSNKEELDNVMNKINFNDKILIFSTDLSHFLGYDNAIKKDNYTIKAIEDLNEKYFMENENTVCGLYSILFLIKICKLKCYKPVFIDYKNSGDVTKDKNSVVGYSSFIF